MEDTLPLPTLYTTGTVSVGAGSTTVTGSGTAWNTAGLQPGDDFRANGLTVAIASINSATSITLAQAWPGSGLSGANYAIRLVDDGVRYLTASNQLLQALGAGTLTSLGAIAGAANVMPYWTGAGVMESTALTAAARSLLDDPDVAAMRATLGLVLASSNTDGTAGRVTRTNDFGLGATTAAPMISDFNDQTTPAGLYAYGGTATNRPSALSSFGHLLVMRQATTGVAQIAFSSNGSAVLWRSATSGTWGAWSRLYTQASILGAVSQSSGVPTGAIIERGSNANGEYVRLADGTQICWGSAAPTWGATGTQTFSLPASFVGDATSLLRAVSIAAQDGAGGAIADFETIRAYGVSNTVFFMVATGTRSAGTSTVRYTAFGRWF